MKRFCTLLLIALICFITPVEANHIDKNDEIKNLKEVEKSYDKRNQEKFDEVVEKAKEYASKHYVKNAAIVSDVDETVLDNREYYKKYKIYSRDKWLNWVGQGESLELKPTVDFLKWAKAKGYKIFLITGRSNAHRDATIKNLEEYNIPFDGIYFKPAKYDDTSASIYKTSVRKKITDEGYKIIINIGDQKSDLKGGFGKGFKLPNHIYKVP